jgi:hypothetical protein
MNLLLLKRTVVRHAEAFTGPTTRKAEDSALIYTD